MTTDSSTVATRQEIALEREQLAESVQRLRGRVEQKRRASFEPSARSLVAAALLGFVLAGGVRASVRLLSARERRRRKREERPAVVGWLAR